jgi:hypothetical protein
MNVWTSLLIKMEGGTKFEPCGGLTDRLRVLPYYVWLAHKSGRKLLIKHTKPHPLEEFFIPPEGGLDWRLPDKYCENEEEFEIYANRSWEQMTEGRSIMWHEHIDNPYWNNTRFVFVNNNLSFESMMDVFHEETGLKADDIWPNLFRRMFKPSTALGKVIDDHANKYGLVPGAYSGAHVRARYPGEGIQEIRRKSNSTQEDEVINMYDPPTRAVVNEIGENAIQCAVKLFPETRQVYFATDTNRIIDYLLHESPIWSPQNKNETLSTRPAIIIVSRPNYNKGSLHIDTHLNFPGREGIAPVDEFYQIFIDLWILSHTKCLSQGLGGFGHFASILSGNHLQCRNRHRTIEMGSTNRCPNTLEMN